MKNQLKSIYEARRDGILVKDWKAYEATFANSAAHVVFMKILLNESERYFVSRKTPLLLPPHGALHNTTRLPLRRLLERLGAEIEVALTENDQLYSEYLSKVAWLGFFTA